MRSETRRNLQWIVLVTGLTLVALCAAIVFVISGIQTQTATPSEKQLIQAKEYLLIKPDADVTPLAYYKKQGMDHQIMLKFVTTAPATNLFNSKVVNASAFQAGFRFKQGEAALEPKLWDMASQSLTGASFWIPTGDELIQRLSVGYVENGDGSLTVYAWRYESGECAADPTAASCTNSGDEVHSL